MELIKTIFGILAIIVALPSFLFFPIIIITVVIGLIKKDFSYLKKYLKFWAWSLGGLLALAILWAIFNFFQTLLF